MHVAMQTALFLSFVMIKKPIESKCQYGCRVFCNWVEKGWPQHL